MVDDVRTGRGIEWPAALCPRGSFVAVHIEGESAAYDYISVLRLIEKRNGGAMYATDARLLAAEQWLIARSDLASLVSDYQLLGDDKVVRVPVDEWSYDLRPSFWKANSLAWLELKDWNFSGIAPNGNVLVGAANFRRIDARFVRGCDSFDPREAPWQPSEDLIRSIYKTLALTA